MAEVKIYHVIKEELVEINSAIFADGDTYVVDDPGRKIIWIWIGSKSTIDEKFTAAHLSDCELITQHRKETTGYQIKTIEQGNEPNEFLDIFGENIKFVEGDVHSALKHLKKKEKKRERKLTE